MSKLDPTGESLESVLASIRRSLAEQSTDVLADDGALQPPSLDSLGAVVPGDEPPPRFLANGGKEPPRAQVPIPAEAPAPTGRAFAGLDDPPPPASVTAALSRPDEASQAPAPPVPQPAEGSKDPLWFLARPAGKDKSDSIPAATVGAAPQPMSAQPAPAAVAQPPAAAPKPALTEIVRGPLPPFFGSTPEAAKVEVSPAPPIPAPLPGAAIIPPASPPAPIVHPSDSAPPHSAVPDSAPRMPGGPAGSATSTAPATPAGGHMREAMANGRAHSIPAEPVADGDTSPASGSPAATAPQLQGLETMVADLLRPMLRRWLDENMPRLVSAALKAEAETLSRWDPKKP
jgi:cell pole-organizing protein PopZ